MKEIQITESDFDLGHGPADEHMVTDRCDHTDTHKHAN